MGLLYFLGCKYLSIIPSQESLQLQTTMPRGIQQIPLDKTEQIKQQGTGTMAI